MAMYKEKTNRRLIGLGVVLFAAGMAAAYLWDLPIDTALHSPQNFAAIFMETMGFYPLYPVSYTHLDVYKRQCWTWP